MSRRSSGTSTKVDLKLNLSSQPRRALENTSRRTSNEEDTSPNKSSSPSSCVSSEPTSSPDATSMVLAGCPRCLMYVMVVEEDPKCPKCKSNMIQDFNYKK